MDEAKRAVVLQRYYHLFEHGELSRLARLAGGLQVLGEEYDRDNWCLVVERTWQSAGETGGTPPG